MFEILIKEKLFLDNLYSKYESKERCENENIKKEEFDPLKIDRNFSFKDEEIFIKLQEHQYLFLFFFRMFLLKSKYKTILNQDSKRAPFCFKQIINDFIKNKKNDFDKLRNDLFPDELAFCWVDYYENKEILFIFFKIIITILKINKISIEDILRTRDYWSKLVFQGNQPETVSVENFINILKKVFIKNKKGNFYFESNIFSLESRYTFF